MTEAGLCNVALLRVGQRQLIDDLAEDSAEARTCAALYPHARDSVLAAHWWPFATRRATLGVLSGASRDGWEYVYAAPSRMAAPQYLWSGSRNPGANQRIAFALEDGDGDVTGQVILTDEEDAVLVYTSSAVAIGLWPSLVVDAVAWLLAVDLAAGLSVKPQVAQAMERKATMALQRAAMVEFNKPQFDMPPESEFVRGR